LLLFAPRSRWSTDLSVVFARVHGRWGDNERGVSFTFGADVVQKFLHKHDLDLVCRAHQVVEDGYEFFAKRQLVTLFSAPNYCGEFDNAGAMMSVDDTLMCSFQVPRMPSHFPPHPARPIVSLSRPILAPACWYHPARSPVLGTCQCGVSR